MSGEEGTGTADGEARGEARRAAAAEVLLLGSAARFEGVVGVFILEEGTGDDDDGDDMDIGFVVDVPFPLPLPLPFSFTVRGPMARANSSSSVVGDSPFAFDDNSNDDAEWLSAPLPLPFKEEEVTMDGGTGSACFTTAPAVAAATEEVNVPLL